MADSAEARASQRRHQFLAGYHASPTGVFVVFVVLWGALGTLLALNLTERPLSRPEVETALLSRGEPEDAWRASINNGRAPLFPVLATFVEWETPYQARQLRWLSVAIAWLAFLPAFWLVWRAAHLGVYVILFCILFGTSPFWIEVGRLATGHSLFAFLALCSTMFLFESLERPRIWLWAFYLLFSALLLHSSLLAPVVLFGQGCAALTAGLGVPASRKWKRIGAMAICWILAGAAFAPMAFSLWPSIEETRLLMLGSGWIVEALRYAGLAWGYTLHMFLVGDAVAPWSALRTVMLAITALVAGLFGLSMIFEHHHRTLRAAFVYAFGAFGMALATFSWLFRDISVLMAPVMLAFLYPYFALAGAYGFGVMHKAAAMPLLAIAIAWHAFALNSYYRQEEYTNWAYAMPVEETLSIIRQNAGEDGMVLYDGTDLFDIAFHYRGEARMIDLGTIELSVEEWADWLDDYDDVVWLRTGLSDNPVWQSEAAAGVLADEFRRVETYEFLREPGDVNEIRSYLAGEPVPRVKYYLDVFERGAAESAP